MFKYSLQIFLIYTVDQVMCLNMYTNIQAQGVQVLKS